MAKTTYAEGRFTRRNESKLNQLYKFPYYDLESNVSTSYKTLIEDLIEKSERRIEKNLIERIFRLSETSEKNVSELYENMNKKMDINFEKSKDNIKKIDLDM